MYYRLKPYKRNSSNLNIYLATLACRAKSASLMTHDKVFLSPRLTPLPQLLANALKNVNLLIKIETTMKLTSQQ
jgi:hypothetical protein